MGKAARMAKAAKQLKKSHQPSESRACQRYSCELAADSFVVSAHDTINRWPSRIQNISRCGVRLLAGRRFEPGTLLGLELQDLRPLATRTALVRVVRVIRCGFYWELGCSWTVLLTTGELGALVGGNTVLAVASAA